MNRFISDYLGKLINVPFEIEMAEEFIDVGVGKPLFKVIIKEDIPKKDLLTSTSLALGEAYMAGKIEVDQDLYLVLDTLLGQINSFNVDQHKLRKILYTSRNKLMQEKEVTSHYDIGNEFYKLWLDETMSYSCAYFKNEEDTLYEAQVNKVDHILDKLFLKRGMSILDIGCGWGFLIRRAVEKFGVRAVGITLSKEQYEKVCEEIKRDGLEGKMDVRLMDYRDLKDSKLQFDRVISVGMLEHVGRGNYELFLENCKAVLKPQGLLLLHFISSLREYPGDAWIKKYIFPGGVIPSLREILNIMGDLDLYALDVESLRRHYTKTLLEWRNNFTENKSEIIKMEGMEFVRMWELYLASCAASFHNGVVDLHQILMSNGVNNDIPMIRQV